MIRRVLLPLLTLFALPLAAQHNRHACAAVAAPEARLACYDRAFPPSQEAAAEAAAAAAKAQAAAFGLHKPTPSPDSAQPTAAVDPERIESRVAKVDHGSGGLRTFHLENGQVWTLAESRSTGQVKAGDTVQVRKGVLAGYTLVTPSKVTLRVRRVR